MLRRLSAHLALAVGVLLGVALSYLPTSFAARNASGTYSLPSGNPVVSGTAISSTVYNNTKSDMATELTDSLSRSGKGPMLAPLEATDGTAAAPSITFDTDTDTGIFKAAANEMGIAAAGASVTKVTSSGIVMTGANPASTTGFTETLTPMNVPKAWGLLNAVGDGTISVVAGFNIASVSVVSDITVTLADDMASANYAVIATAEDSGSCDTIMSVSTRAAGSFVLKGRTSADAAVNFSTDSKYIHFVVFGAQ